MGMFCCSLSEYEVGEDDEGGEDDGGATADLDGGLHAADHVPYRCEQRGDGHRGQRVTLHVAHVAVPRPHDLTPRAP